MEISVIIVTFNSSPFIGRCLSSILEGVGDVPYELIIIDNNSTDETCTIIKDQFPQAIHLANTFNAGFARANNLAIQRARGEFVLFINPDIVWKRGRLERAIRFLKEHPEVGALGCRLSLADGSWQKSHGGFPTLMREFKEAFYLPRLFPRSRWMSGIFAYEESPKPKPVDWVSGAFFLCYRRVLDEVGSFDERYFLYYEDIDLSKRIREKGKDIYYYPEVEVVHLQRWPALIDFGESPYIYFDKFFGRKSARTLRYILIVKTIIRVLIFLPLSCLSRKAIFRDKGQSYYRTLKFHLVDARRIISGLDTTPEKRSNQVHSY